jgi:tubulin-specific chaperone A
MAPPSPLAIATSSLLRLVKEENSYHKELLQQEARVQRLVNGPDGSVDEDNVEFLINQEVYYG